MQYDDDEDYIANNYKKFRRLNDDANMSERKLARVDTDLLKQKQNWFLKNKLEHLVDITDKEITDAEATSQTQSLKTLQQEVENLKKEFNRINVECEGTREKYQSSSSVALQLSHRLTQLKQQNEKIERKLFGPGMAQLPELIKKMHC